MSAGKGDTPRPVDLKRYGENYDRIFRKRDVAPKRGNRIRCEFCGSWMTYYDGWQCPRVECVANGAS